MLRCFLFRKQRRKLVWLCWEFKSLFTPILTPSRRTPSQVWTTLTSTSAQSCIPGRLQKWLYELPWMAFIPVLCRFPGAFPPAFHSGLRTPGLEWRVGWVIFLVFHLWCALFAPRVWIVARVVRSFSGPGLSMQCTGRQRRCKAVGSFRWSGGKASLWSTFVWLSSIWSVQGSSKPQPITTFLAIRFACRCHIRSHSRPLHCLVWLLMSFVDFFVALIQTRSNRSSQTFFIY